MAIRFRKIVKIFPGVYLNISKSGISFSFGKKGLSLNIGKKGTKITAGLPGSGVSVSKQLKNNLREDRAIEFVNEQHEEYLNLDEDALYLECIIFVTESRRASVSSVQRRLKIGYNRAACMIETMERDGIVSCLDSYGNREVLLPEFKNKEYAEVYIVQKRANMENNSNEDIYEIDLSNCYYFKAFLELNNCISAISYHGAVTDNPSFFSGFKGEVLRVDSPDRVTIEESDFGKQYFYYPDYEIETEIGKQSFEADSYRDFLILIREFFEDRIAVPEKMEKTLRRVQELREIGHHKTIEFIDLYGGEYGIIDRLFPSVIDLLPIMDKPKETFKSLGFRTLRDISNISDEILLSYKGINKTELKKIRSFIRNSNIPLDYERIEREVAFRAYKR